MSSACRESGGGSDGRAAEEQTASTQARLWHGRHSRGQHRGRQCGPTQTRPHMRESPSPDPFSVDASAPRARTRGRPRGTSAPPQVALRTQEVVDVVSSDEKVLDFPKAEITSEEKARRAMDPSCRRSSDQASRSLATRLQGGAIRGRVCAFLATRAEHLNTQAWGRRKDVKVFGCSDDWR
jgi:hypothetical protein